MLTRVHFDMHQRPMAPCAAMEFDRKSAGGMGSEGHVPLALRLDYCFDVISMQVDGDQAVTRPEQFHPIALDSAHGAHPICHTAICEEDLEPSGLAGLLPLNGDNRHADPKHRPNESLAWAGTDDTCASGHESLRFTSTLDKRKLSHCVRQVGLDAAMSVAMRMLPERCESPLGAV
jgi:hypothetical protein